MNIEEEFYDAVTGFESDQSSGEFSESSQTVLDEMGPDKKESSMLESANNGGRPQENGIKKHRISLPAPMFSRSDFSVWTILKKCIGLELSKITMPIVFNEPLSFLQRITEYMEHTYLINKACTLTDSVERMQVRTYYYYYKKKRKKFSGVGGNTFKMTTLEDLGFRFISEQVSHHPPVSAFHSEGLNNEFIFHGSIYPKLKFWGKSVEAEPKGTITLELPKYKEAYTWTNPTCCVHNVIIGKLWIEQYGNVEVTNHSTGEKCVLNFKSCGLFGKELHRVEGYIQDKSKKKLYVVYGKWTECLWCIDPVTYENYKKNEKRGDQKKTKQNEEPVTSENDEADDMPEIQETVHVIPGSKLLWRICSRPSHSSKMYNFTKFAVMLNELDKELETILAPSDCRLRPDIRAMENGNMELASKEKERLEEKQRASRKERAKSEEEWRTRWFQQGTNLYTGNSDWIYTGEYFNRNFTDCPNIY
uniref:Oxysterol-binding protein n=1 Tax=Latimeria chalumnae TaxID=7897 RepID=H3AHM8_LATCH